MTRKSTLWILGGLVVALLLTVVLFAAGVIRVTGEEAAGPAPEPTTAGAFDPARIYRERVTGVALIVAAYGPGQQGLGSGFLVDEDGHVLTNAHVVADRGRTAAEVRVTFQDDTTGRDSLPATVVGVDQSTDIAVLRVELDDVDAEPLPLGRSADVQIGEPVVAIGNPLGFSFSLTNGIVSGTGRNLTAPNGAVIPNGIQTNAAINQGNSGGPLIDADGEVIGVNEQIASPSGSFSGLGFAVPIDTVKTVMRQIIETGTVETAYLGIQGQTISPAVSSILGLPTAQGVLVAAVDPGSPADQAGLRGGSRTFDIQGATYVVGGDIITQLNGTALSGMEELAAAIAESEPGDRIELTIDRDVSTESVNVTLGVRPTSGA
jgi:S1-C subfamily serine protease